MSDSAGSLFDDLVHVMRRLRSPDGCPWDREQTVKTLRPFVLEETYELLDALDREDYDSLRHELGDFLLEAVFLAQICEEEGRFSIADSIRSITDKLIRRHPHVDLTGVPHGGSREGSHEGSTRTMTPDQVKEKWEDIKARERQNSGAPDKTLLSGVPRALPSLLRAYELSTRAATVGFDWAKTADVLDKIDEEVRELREAVATRGPRSAETEEELGDLFFALANLARKLGVEPEAALRIANDKFQRRFDAMEREASAAGTPMKGMSLDELEGLWTKAKANSPATKGNHEGREGVTTKDTKGQP
jgi:MazG family protein